MAIKNTSLRLQAVLVLAVALSAAVPVAGQSSSISLSSGAAAPGGTVSLNVAVNSTAGSEPAAVEWQLVYPSSAVTAVTMAAGPGTTGASKTLSCSNGVGSITCVVSGMNSTRIQNNVVAVATFQLAAAVTTDVAVQTSGTSAALPDGVNLPASGGGSLITLMNSVKLASLTCGTATINTPGSTTCTATLSGPAPGAGAMVALSDNNTSLAVPSSVTVAGGATSASFTATAAQVAVNSTATITGSYGGASASAPLTLAAPVLATQPSLSALSCAPSSISSGGARTCTVALTAAAPAAGFAVSIADSSAVLNVPASINVAPGATSGTFAATAGSTATAQSVTVTASASSVSKTALVSVMPAASTTGGLVAAYSFNEGTGATVADASGNGNTGTIRSASWTSGGKFGNALAFNGTNSWVTINDSASLRLSTAMTLEAWVKPSSVSNSWRDVLYKGNDNYYLMATSNSGRAPAAGATIASVTGETFGTAALAKSQWAHLAATYDGTALRLFVNGVQVASQPRSGSMATSNQPLQIGGDSIFGQFFAGTIDEVRVYNIALTQAQIQADMNAPVSSGTAADTQPPAAPSGLAATAASGQISLQWTASTDNVAVTGYRAERCQGAGCTNFVQIAAPAGTTYTDTSLSAGTSYSYRVRATDAAGNLSGYSNAASATTAAAGGLVAAYSFNENSGTVVTDLSGNGNSGMIANATWTMGGKYGNALAFNGASAMVTVNDSASLR
ncbi:MAG: LamG-like jellyroll fold domain-containing protein, partial [Armatimonadia bacterium]